MKIIPAIDLIDGKCVRLSQGDYDTKKIYNENPLEVAAAFEAAGIEYLHVVDLDGAKASQIINYKVLEQIATKTNLKIDFGGGLKSDKDLEIAFNSGANQITGGSIAVKNNEVFESWIEKYGSEKIILGADFYPDNSGGKIAIVFSMFLFWRFSKYKTVRNDIKNIAAIIRIKFDGFSLFRMVFRFFCCSAAGGCIPLRTSRGE